MVDDFPPVCLLFKEIANHFREVSSEQSAVKGFNPNQVLLGIRSGPWEGNDRASNPDYWFIRVVYHRSQRFLLIL